MSKKKNGEFSYDEAMRELQTIVNSLQHDAIKIDDLAQNVKRASELIKLCREKLHQTEKEIQNLNDDADVSE
jgi:exodeoxyribonuclease VII small subunit